MKLIRNSCSNSRVILTHFELLVYMYRPSSLMLVVKLEHYGENKSTKGYTILLLIEGKVFLKNTFFYIIPQLKTF